MKKEQMVGTRVSLELIRGLELIEDVEQSDRSTIVRRLLAQAIERWKLEHYVRLYGDGKLTLARAARDAGVSMWEMMDYAGTRKVPAQYRHRGSWARPRNHPRETGRPRSQTTVG